MITVTLYIKDNSPACDQAKIDLESLQVDYPHQLVVLNYDKEPDLIKFQSDLLPIAEIGPFRLRNPFTRQDLQVALGAAKDRQSHLEMVGDQGFKERQDRGHNISKSDRFSYWFTRHYMAVFNTLIFVYVGLPFLAPILMRANIQAPARVIYSIYSTMCHQLAFRSFFLFGEQSAYPRAMAAVPGLLTLQQATGINENDVQAARAFIGTPTIGYKVAFCERDVAIYGSILLFGLIFSFNRDKLKSLPWYIWLIIGIVPMGIDGVSQLPSLLTIAMPAWVPIRESTPFLRVLTGFLFGFTTAWYGFPFIYEAMEETKRMMKYKMVVVNQAAVSDKAR